MRKRSGQVHSRESSATLQLTVSLLYLSLADICTTFWGSGIINIDGVKWDMVLIFAISVVLLRKTKWNPVFVMILAGVLKVLVALI